MWYWEKEKQNSMQQIGPCEHSQLTFNSSSAVGELPFLSVVPEQAPTCQK
jgi:hypothetical protein